MTGWLVLGSLRYLVRLRAAGIAFRSLSGMRNLGSAVAHIGLPFSFWV